MVLKKNSNDFEIVELECEDGFTIKTKNKNIIIYDKEMINNIIDKEFSAKYKKILYIIMDINSSDDATDTDTFLVREQISELKNMLLNKYKKYISKELLNKYLKMLLLLEDKIVVKEKSNGR